MANINEYGLRTGRLIKENGTVVNEGEMLETIATNLTGDSSKVTEYFAGSSATTHTLAGTGKGVSVANDGATSITITIDSISIEILSNETFDGQFEDFTEIVVTNASSSAYRIIVLG